MTAPAASTPSSVSPSPSRRALWAAWVVAAAWFAVHAWAPAGPPRSVWGVDMWEPWPVWMRWGAALGLSVLVLPPVVARCVAALQRLTQTVAARDLSRPTRAGLSVLFVLLCWFGRTGNIYHGDGIVLAKVARSTQSLLHYTGYSDGRATAEQVVEYLIHRGVNAALGPITGLDSYDTIALTHAVCGGVLLWILTGLFVAWWPRLGRRQFGATALFCTLGVTQLWFGHHETYTIGSTAFVGFLWSGTRALQNRTGLWEPAVWATAAMTVHTVFGGALLGLAWVWLVRVRGASIWKRALGAFWLIAPVALALAVVIVAYRALGFSWDMIAAFVDRPGHEQGATFVPLFETTNVLERYTFFSVGHILDLLNESLLTGAYALPLLIGLACAPRTGLFRGDPIPMFLVASTLVYGVVIVAINPPGGGRREWDVFAPPAVGYGLLAIYLLLSSSSKHAASVPVALVCFVAGAAHAAPWLVNNARIDLPAYIEHRAAGDRAHQDGLTRSALLEWEQALAILPSPELASRIGDAHRKLGDDDAALTAYRQALRWENRSELAAFGDWEHAWVAIGEILERRGDDAAARRAYSQALRVGEERHNEFADRPAAYLGLARIAERAGDSSAARRWRERAAAVAQPPSEARDDGAASSG